MGWFLIFIVIPILMPMVLVGLYSLAPVDHQAGAKLIQQVKDGQLSWPASGFCASALYELAEGAAALGHVQAHWMQGLLIILLLLSVTIALMSIVFPTQNSLQDTQPTASLKPFRMLLSSVIVVGLAAIAYTSLHFVVTV